jgi:hypothetical protein
MLARADIAPTAKYPFVPAEVLATYKKITRLQCVQRCGLCGTTRHPTQPFWTLGMRVCRYCLQENLVSHTVLAERYWVTVCDPHKLSERHAATPEIHLNFVDAIASRVFYLRDYSTARQRLEMTCDPLDFIQPRQRAAAVTWLFWRPHLQTLMDLSALEREARAKHRAAERVRAMVRRALTLRTLAGTQTRKDQALTCRGIRPTVRTDWSRRPDKRLALFKLRRGVAVDPPVIRHKYEAHLNRKLAEYEDRVDCPCVP